MFQFLFKYPSTIFQKGDLVLLAPWPVWLLVVAVLAAGGLLLWHVRRHGLPLRGPRPAAIWLLETALVALVLLLLWRPALSVATLRPQQNIIAVLVDDSRSMGIAEGAKTRSAHAAALLQDTLLDPLGRKFQVRLYRFGKEAERIQKIDQLAAASSASRIGDSLQQVLAESATLPLGAVVLLSDGADNSGGIDLDTISQIRRRRIPIHTIGFGREKFARDLEIADVALPARTLADSRLTAQVTFRQFGFADQKARLSVRDGDKTLASEVVTLKADGVAQTESLLFNAGIAGPRNLQIALDPLSGEENRDNNAVARLVTVEARKPRILYIEGEPRWEYKFIRRGVEDDRSLHLVSMLRTTQNKIYRQGIDGPTELEQGFPAKAEELFGYQGLIIGSVEASYFTPAQQELIREFAGRRGGGVLFLGGRAALGEGGYARSTLAELLPVQLTERTGTFHREQANAELTAAGRMSLICRLEEDAARNAERWKKMPLLADYNEVGEPKPGALVLMELNSGGRRRSPLLAAQNYGRGRAVVLATGGSWRWRMLQEHTDKSHAMFWQQMLRYLVAESPGQVVASTPRQVLSDANRVPLRVEVRDKAFKPLSNVRVEARIMGPEGAAGVVELQPQALEEGVYTAEWSADKPGSYVAEILARRDQEEVGRDVLQFRREDGVAENFRAVQNRELLEKLAEQTGGRYYRPEKSAQLADEISYSEAGITTRETRDLWDMPAVFLLALMIRGSEWVLRRKWGAV
jgi:uncharacterized membrane protein